MDKDIQEIRRRAGIVEADQKVLTLQKRHRDLKTLNRALVEMMMDEKEGTNEIIGTPSEKDIEVLRKQHGVPDHYTPAQAMMHINQHRDSDEEDLGQWISRISNAERE